MISLIYIQTSLIILNIICCIAICYLTKEQIKILKLNEQLIKINANYIERIYEIKRNKNGEN